LLRPRQDFFKTQRALRFAVPLADSRLLQAHHLAVVPENPPAILHTSSTSLLYAPFQAPQGNPGLKNYELLGV